MTDHNVQCGSGDPVPHILGQRLTAPTWEHLLILVMGDNDSGATLQGPNDGTPDGKGGAYFTLSGPWQAGPIVGKIVHLTAGGKPIPVANDLYYANGITFGKDGRLYVNESEAGSVTSFAVSPEGVLSDRHSFVQLYRLGQPADVYPDGIKLDRTVISISVNIVPAPFWN